MKKAFVAIGVNKSGGLPILQAAADGARRMANWAEDQGFDTVVLTDVDRPVTLSDIVKSVRKLVDSRTYGQLVVYFSGHGFLKGSNYEIWLLSGSAEDANEAVNVPGSIDLARNCGIPHLVFISDACRSIASALNSNYIMGGVIFPILAPRAPGPDVDVFYATIPGNAALEIPPDAAAENYRGIFTACMLDALSGEEISLVRRVQDGAIAKQVIPSRPLKQYLLSAVPDAATRVSIKLTQFPEIRIESDLPNYLAEVADESHELLSSEDGDRDVAQSDPRSYERMERLNRKILWRDLSGETGKLTLDPFESVTAADSEAIDRLYGLRGRLSFETRTGFTIHGAKVLTARSSHGTCDVFVENGLDQVRVHADQKPGATAIQFHTGCGVCLAALPGYVATVVVGDGGDVVSVNYTPARGTDLYQEYEAVASDLERRRAIAAVASRNGSFVIDKREAGSLAEKLRMMKVIDPTLGIYAAYAYSQVGRHRDVVSIGEYMNEASRHGGHEGTVPFDVAMLNRYTKWSHTPIHCCPPYMPMLTQGWALLGPAEPFLPKIALKARQYLIPSLWTSFALPGMDLLLHAIDQKAFP